MLVEYFFTDERTITFLMRSDFLGPRTVEVEVTRDRVREFVTGAFRSGPHPELDSDAWRALSGPLVAPLREVSEPDDVIWFVPHDALHYLPLHAAELDGEPLIERNAICYSPTASVMRYCKRRRTARFDRAVVLGDSRGDLPHAREEALMTGELFGTTPLCGPNASKQQLLDALGEGDVDVVHLACHGEFDAATPMHSRVLLAPGDDDHVTAEEFLSMSLPVSLMTLSACESGVSDRIDGDELIGLTRALLHAGVSSAIVTLWSVDDLSTNLVMREFYRRLCAAREPGAERPLKVDALRAAQRAVRRMTAADVVAFCDERLAVVNGDAGDRRVVLALARAAAQAAAGDLDAAAQAYSAVTAELSPTHALAEPANQSLRLLRFKARHTRPTADYQTQLFRDPRSWAAPILVGDWH